MTGWGNLTLLNRAAIRTQQNRPPARQGVGSLARLPELRVPSPDVRVEVRIDLAQPARMCERSLTGSLPIFAVAALVAVLPRRQRPSLAKIALPKLPFVTYVSSPTTFVVASGLRPLAAELALNPDLRRRRASST